MSCYLCEKLVCYHAILRFKGKDGVWLIKCEDCGVESIGHRPYMLSLPCFEGKYNPTSNTYFDVCKECYDKYTLGVKANA